MNTLVKLGITVVELVVVNIAVRAIVSKTEEVKLKRTMKNKFDEAIKNRENKPVYIDITELNKD